jgi:hypothetical protein
VHRLADKGGSNDGGKAGSKHPSVTPNGAGPATKINQTYLRPVGVVARIWRRVRFNKKEEARRAEKWLKKGTEGGRAARRTW